MSSFWERQRAKLQGQNPPGPVSNSQPWWSRGSEVLAGRQQTPQNPSQGRTDVHQGSDGKIDGHDVSKIGLLKGGAMECPVCPPDPKSGIRGNMYSPPGSGVFICFNCNYRDDGRFQGETAGLIAVTEGPSYKARQTDSGGRIVNNYKGNITKAEQAEGRIN